MKHHLHSKHCNQSVRFFYALQSVLNLCVQVVRVVEQNLIYRRDFCTRTVTENKLKKFLGYRLDRSVSLEVVLFARLQQQPSKSILQSVTFSLLVSKSYAIAVSYF